MDEIEKEKVGKLLDMFYSWNTALKEIKRYLEQDVDSFTVSSGPWTIGYDSAKESEAKE